MSALFRMAALLLLSMMMTMTMTVAALPALPMMPQAGLSPQLAGCHGHRSGNRSHNPSQNPLPAPPVSFQCCVNGHHAALPSAMFSSRPLPAQISDSDREAKLPVDSALTGNFAALLLPSVSPPHPAPRRI
jgi:hypothetical protein